MKKGTLIFTTLIGVLCFVCCAFVFTTMVKPYLSKNVDSVEKIVVTTIEEESELKEDFSNPVLIYGSSFGNFFQVLYRQADFKTMLKFTHSSSIKKLGKKVILDRYKKMEFNYNITLSSIKREDDGTYLLNYTSDVFATKSILRLRVGIENDTSKIILPDNINEFPRVN